MRTTNIFYLIFLLGSQVFLGQNKITGVINPSEGLNDVNISIQELNKFTTSSEHGYFSLDDLPNGTFRITFSHIGYKTKTEEITLNNSLNYEIVVELEKKIIQLGEAIISSSKREELIKNVSLPLELISKDKLNFAYEITISDLLKKETGLSVVKDGPWATNVNIRGLSKQNIVYLIDGSRIETSTNIAAGLSLMDINDFETVEIVKGGLSSLYGTGATGGVVNIKSKEANFDSNIYLSSQFISGISSVNNGYSNYLNIRTGDKNWSLKLSGSVRSADDTDIPGGKLENSSFKDEGFAGTMKYAPLENIILNIDYQKFNAYDVGIPGGEPFPEPAVAKYKYAGRELFQTSVDVNSINDYLIRTSLNYYHQIIEREVEIKPNAMVTSKPGATHTTDGIVLQSDWIMSDNNYLIGGIDYWQREYEGLREITNLKSSVIKVDKPVPNSKFRSFGFFLKDDMKVNNKFNVSISARYDFINITNEETKNPVYLISNDVKNTVVKDELASYKSYNENNSSLSGSIGSIYKFKDTFDLTLNLGYNFRSPSLEERYQYIDLGGIVYLGNPSLEPEEGLSFDAGFRIWEDNLNFRFNTFLNLFSNLVIDDVLYSDSIYIKNNVGKARFYGFDAKVDYNIYKNYLIYSGLSFVRGEDLTKNTDLPQISPLNGFVGVIVPLFNLVRVDFMLTFASDQDKTGIGENRTGGYTYYDLSFSSNKISIGYVNITAVAGIQNILNRKYREHLSTYRGYDMVEPGRNIFTKLIFDFN